MKKLAIIVPIISILAGVGGFLLRSRELNYVFDDVTGLPGRGALTTMVLIAFVVANLLAALIFGICIYRKRKAPKGFDNAFGIDPMFYPIVFVVIGIVWLVGTFLLFQYQRSIGAFALTDSIYLILSALAAICVTFFAIEMYQDFRRKAIYALSLVPTIFLCFWLIVLYDQNATNPILLRFVYQCLAIVFASLAFYFTSGFIYNKPAPGRAVISYYLSILFSSITLADDIHIGQKLIFGAIIGASLVHLSVILRNLEPKEPEKLNAKVIAEQIVDNLL
ncbi:MAG: hypothetical protein FWC13_08590 [Oscillospiraceae bacterium]|nr:hypothetical protein [Oscillospiraceae bacterium]